jgi:hypothetical protein
MTQQYTLVLDDVRAYVASKDSRDNIGIPGHSGACLLASTLAWKYGIPFSVAITIFLQVGGHYQDIEDEKVQELGVTFDDLAERDHERFPPAADPGYWPFITKDELEDNPDFAILFVPERKWSNPSSLDGIWLYPEWREDHWEFIEQ